MYKTPEKSTHNLPRGSRIDGKCVCQICTCGKHSCPPEPRPKDPTHFDTTNKYKINNINCV